MINHWEYIHHLTTLNRGFEVPDLRDDLQRVAAPAEVCVWEAEKFEGNLRGDSWDDKRIFIPPNMSDLCIDHH